MENINTGEQRDDVRLLTLDIMLKKVGHCGRFQVIFSVLGMIPFLPAVWGMMFMTFGNYNPGWSCLDDIELDQVEENSSLFIITDTQNTSEQTRSMSVCNTMRKCENLSFNKVASTIVTEWALICEDSWAISIIISVQMFGVLLGSVVSGQIGDKLGRKYNIHGGAALLTIFNIIAIFSISWKMYAVMRFFIGFASGNILSTGYVYVSEYITAGWRAFIASFPFWNVCTFSFTLCVFALKDWRHVHIATACISLLAFLPVFWLPESIRFLTVHGKLRRADKIIETVARLNRKPLPDTSIMTTIAEIERESHRARTFYTYQDLFHKKIRKNSIVLGMAWFNFAFGYFMVGFGLKALSGDFFVNLMLFSVLATPLRVIALTVATKVGRKVSVCLFVLLSSVLSLSLVGVQLMASEEGKVIPTVVMALGTSITIEAAWGVLVISGMELFPTPVRNLSYAYTSSLGRFAACIAPYIVSKENVPIYGAFLLLGLLLLISFAGLLTIQETRQRPLQDNFLGRTTSRENRSVNLDCVDDVKEQLRERAF